MFADRTSPLLHAASWSVAQGVRNICFYPVEAQFASCPQIPSLSSIYKHICPFDFLMLLQGKHLFHSEQEINTMQ